MWQGMKFKTSPTRRECFVKFWETESRHTRGRLLKYWLFLTQLSSSICVLGVFLTEKSMPMVSYWRWILSARSSKSRTIEGFSRDMAELRPERTTAGHVRAMHSQSCKLARHTPLWFPRRQYKAPWRYTKEYKWENWILEMYRSSFLWASML